MKKRKLGRTGIEVSEIAFGGVEIGMPYGIGINGTNDMLSEKQAIELLLKAKDLGINFFDTARMYGTSESLMGKAFRACRETIIISTKCRHFIEAGGQLPNDSLLKHLIEKSVEESLHELQTDYLDVFMLHQADMEILENPTIAATFEALKKAGTVRAIGASTYSLEETDKAIEAGIWDVIQLPLNLLDQRQQLLFDKAKQQEVGIVVRSILMKGLLSDRGKNLHPSLHRVEKHIAGYEALLNEKFLDLPTLAVKFGLSFEEVSSVLVGIDRPDYLTSSVGMADGNYMDAPERQQARRLAYPDPGFLNLHHWSKMGWLT